METETTIQNEIKTEIHSLARRMRTKLWKTYFDARQNETLTNEQEKSIDKICLELTKLMCLMESE